MLIPLLLTVVALQVNEAEVGVAPPVAQISWDGMVEEMDRTSPLMAAARSGLESYERKLEQTDWAYFPVFGIEAGAAPVPSISQGDEQSLNVDWSRWGYVYRVKATMVQPLYTFGKLTNLKRAALHGIELGNAEIEVARWDLRYRAAQAYYGAVLAKELRDILKDGRSWLERAEQRMVRLRDEDSDDYDQIAHLRLKTRSSEFYALEAQNEDLDLAAHQGLRLLLSRDADQPVTPVENTLVAIDAPLLSAERYLGASRRTNPQVMRARSGAAATHALADAEWSKLWPDLVLVGEVSQTDSNAVQPDASEALPGNVDLGLSGGLLVGIRWDLDVAQTLLKSRDKRAEAQRIGHQGAVAQDLAELEIRRLRQRIESTRRLIKATARSEKAARGWLTATWDLYDGGFGVFKDVMDALVQYYGKRLNHLQLLQQHNLLFVELSRAVGQDVTKFERK